MSATCFSIECRRQWPVVRNCRILPDDSEFRHMYSKIQRRKKPHFHTLGKLGKQLQTWCLDCSAPTLPLLWTNLMFHHCHLRWCDISVKSWCCLSTKLSTVAPLHLPSKGSKPYRNPISSSICCGCSLLQGASGFSMLLSPAHHLPGELTPSQSQSGSWKFSGHHHKLWNWRIPSRAPWNKMSSSHRWWDREYKDYFSKTKHFHDKLLGFIKFTEAWN